ncbi:hypothetical protein OS035_18260 [Rhizobium sp. 268]|uniref:hypothetical protein n=1 Tax=Rhizobium sp. 268 TaxID=2996375 RepID=UPI002F944C93
MQITRDLVVRYLVNLGWRRIASSDSAIFRVDPPEVSPFGAKSIFFSHSAQPEGAAREASLAIDIIQDTYGKPRGEIEKSILALTHDLLIGKVPDEFLRNDAIELRAVRSYLNGMRGVIASAGTTELTGRRAFSKSIKQALDYADRCAFEHTFKSSFGLAIEAPLRGHVQTAMEFGSDKVPLGRRVVQRIAFGLASLQEAVRVDDPEPILERPDGLNAGMCKDMLAIIEQSGLPRIDLAITWSPEVSPPSLDTSSLVLETRQIPVLERAREHLLKDDDAIPATVVGRVVDLHSSGNPADDEDDGKQSIQVRWDSPEYGVRKVLVRLDMKLYRTAYEAHGRGDLISVEGMLSQKHTWRLERVKKLEVLRPASS